MAPREREAENILGNLVSEELQKAVAISLCWMFLGIVSVLLCDPVCPLQSLASLIPLEVPRSVKF